MPSEPRRTRQVSRWMHREPRVRAAHAGHASAVPAYAPPVALHASLAALFPSPGTCLASTAVVHASTASAYASIGTLEASTAPVDAFIMRVGASAARFKHPERRSPRFARIGTRLSCRYTDPQPPYPHPPRGGMRRSSWLSRATPHGRIHRDGIRIASAGVRLAATVEASLLALPADDETLGACRGTSDAWSEAAGACGEAVDACNEAENRDRFAVSGAGKASSRPGMASKDFGTALLGRRRSSSRCTAGVPAQELGSEVGAAP
jgi:hypothetical protein